MAFVLFELSAPTPRATRELEMLKRARLDPVRNALLRQEHTPWDFIFLPALLSVTDRTIDYGEDDPPPFFKPVDFLNAHASGAQALRLWPMAVACSRSGAADCKRWERRLEALMADTEQWADDFVEVSHWVPQFLWMAIWLERGRP
jgi:hypothetical protein